MTVNTVCNFLAKYGEGSLHELRELLESGTPYQVIADKFEVSHVAVVKWRQKFFVDRVYFNHETDVYLVERNGISLDREREEQKKISMNALTLIPGGLRNSA